MATHQFISRVGMHPPFFTPKDGDKPPVVKFSGPTGDFDIEPTDSGDGRWSLLPPEPFWATGDYTIAIKGGDTYEIKVRKHSGRIMPDESRRLAELSPEDHAAALAFIKES